VAGHNGCIRQEMCSQRRRFLHAHSNAALTPPPPPEPVSAVVGVDGVAPSGRPRAHLGRCTADPDPPAGIVLDHRHIDNVQSHCTVYTAQAMAGPGTVEETRRAESSDSARRQLLRVGPVAARCRPYHDDATGKPRRAGSLATMIA
jgi:hypothetical protein